MPPIPYFQTKLLQWFEVNGRDFPWRDPSTSNYERIISEVLLQRTRADMVSRYYFTFFAAFPDWPSLCMATIPQLEAILQPLGLYKQRARRLRRIADDYQRRQGKLPRTSNEVQESDMAALYIANAYELFVLKKHAPLLDVNMARLLRRFFGLPGDKDLRMDPLLMALAWKIVDKRQAIQLNWAILDFAALVCKARKPQCQHCPLKRKCAWWISPNIL